MSARLLNPDSSVSIDINMQGSLFVSSFENFNKCKLFEKIHLLSNSGNLLCAYSNPKIVEDHRDETFVYFSIIESGNSTNVVTNEKTLYNIAKIVSLLITDEQALLVPDIYPIFIFDHAYKKDERFTYNGRLFKVNQDHTSAAQWVPGESGTESLYTCLEMAGDGHLVWTQPTGAHNAYNTGDIVHYPTSDDPLYKSLIDGNVWSPDAYPQGWELYTGGESSDVETPTEPSTDPSEDDKPETSYPDFVQPTGAHDAYNTGDIVKFNGQFYKSTIDNNVYSPEAYPAGWELYTE